MGREASEKREPFNPVKVSASRLDSLAKCGIGFRYKYIDRMPGARAGSWALFGSAVHKALERWGRDRSQDLFRLMEDAWLECAQGDPVFQLLREYQPLSRKAIRLHHSIQQARPEIKKVRATGDWKKSDVVKEIAALRRKHFGRMQESHWLFRDGKDDLFADYDDSLVLAKRYEERHRNRPPSIGTEIGFEVDFCGFRLIGSIDSVEPILSPEGELLGLGIVDYKTAQEIGAPMKHYRQLVFYYIAVLDLQKRGILPEIAPILPGIDYVRHQERKFISVGPLDLVRIERELNAYRSTCESGAFLPASTMTNAERCDFPENCCQKTTCGGPGGEATPLEVIEFA